MRVRVKFRYRADTGEVETFVVEDLHSGPRLADHDARHDRVAADVARVVENNALIEEVSLGAGTLPVVTVRSTEEEPEPRRERQADD